MVHINTDTFIFLATLLVSIPLGSLYKQIEDAERKRHVGAGIGLLIALAICGRYILWSVLLVWVNIITLKCCDKRTVHQVSLCITWLFLLYIHNYVQCTKYATWLLQILALRLVGLAFEINIHDKTKTEDKRPSPATEDAIVRLSVSDIVYYAYFFIGFHKGPYYTWKTFNEHFNSRISMLGDFHVVTEQKLKKALLFTVGYLIMRTNYPLSMYEEEEFYANYGTDYRFLSCMPQLLMYMVEQQIIMLLSTSTYTEAGFGVYPARSLAVPGAGPTVPVKLAEATEELPENEEYNFSMLTCFDNEKLLMGPKMIDTMRGWDMATRYWFSHYIARGLIKSNFEVRTACSFLLWTIWAGPSLQNTIISLTLWMYMHLESEYANLHAETLKGPWDLGFAIMRMFCLFYLTPCYIIEDKNVALRYYNSIYWIYHIVLGVLIVAAIGLQRNRYRPQLGLSANVFSKPDSITQKFIQQKRASTTSVSKNQQRKASTVTETQSTNVTDTSGGQNRRLSDVGSIQSRQGNTEPDSGPSTSGNNPDSNPNNNPK